MSEQIELLPQPSRQRTFWRTFFRQPMGAVGLVMMLIALIAAVFAEYIAPYNPRHSVDVTIEDVYAPPDAQHIMGKDDAGKDVFSAFIYGSRVSMIVGFFGAFISVVVGGLVGIVAGFYGGRVENILMRFTDTMLVIPALPLQIVIIAMTSPNLTNIILVIGLLGWQGTARLVRSQTLAVSKTSCGTPLFKSSSFSFGFPLIQYVLVLSLAIRRRARKIPWVTPPC
jgi:peptide/nickel transport system permease protein